MEKDESNMGPSGMGGGFYGPGLKVVSSLKYNVSRLKLVGVVGGLFFVFGACREKGEQENVWDYKNFFDHKRERY